MSRDRASGRGVIYLNVGWSSLPTLLRRSAFGRESWYLRSSLSSRAGARILRLFAVRPIDIDSVDELVIGPRSTEGAMDRALATLEARSVEPILAHLAARYPLARDPAGVLRAVLVRAMSERSLDAFYAEAWASTRGFRRVVFVGSSPWDSNLLTDRGRGMSVVGLCARGLAWFGSAAARLRQRNAVGAPWVGSPSPAPVAADSEPLLQFATARDATTLLVLNRGVTYGGLYKYDHVLSAEPASPLHPTRVVLMGRTGGPGNAEGIKYGFPAVPSAWKRIGPVLWLYLGCVRKFGVRYPPREVWRLAHACVSAEAQRAVLQRDFPSARLAVLAYDMQVPLELVLALESAGIRTVALNERPLSVVVGSQPFAVSTLLTASGHFSAAARGSRSVSVVDAPAVGMWRTDFIREYAEEPAAHDWETATAHGRRRVLVLPYHVQPGAGFGTNPLATSLSSVRHFVADILDLAERRPNAFFLFRGKSDGWVNDPRLADLAARASLAPNVGVSRTYDRLNESYRLAARADLIVAKYTSLVDEALACDIPTLLHDYTANSRDVARTVVTYLPRELWALNRDELHSRFDWALDAGAGFGDFWAGHRREIYGNFADGHVRSRARTVIVE